MEVREVFKCDICGNVVELLQAGAPALVCCGEDMKKLEAQTEDSSVEKHVPVVEETDDGIKILIGSTLHPMEDDHLIRFIEVLTEDKVLRAEFKAGDEPKAVFNVDQDEVIEVREFCNLHGLWKA
ncbi:desulfoferrodoxin [Acetohalobium arabaticum]|uniref:Desulfoferrodoxin n=1 Tax=Acetohalobium arabaticum (strain ATCC 49924 / DSM 5501 / Z-7288) TaxID=574087 RepID=D9QPT1_ACEAZ|nr:desulfoferrodoxin [Acetohalobium arabaticum]ADL12522.1 desulfoferrodoxin [Acetohalobium arabaticum DSM 5501]